MGREIKCLLFSIIISIAFIFSCSSDTKSLRVKPTSYDFEDVKIGNSEEIEIILKHKYSEDLTIRTIDTDGSPDFDITSVITTPVDLVRNTEFVIKVEFEPSISGPIEGSVVITHDKSDDALIIPLKGVGIACARIEFSETSYDFNKLAVSVPHTHDFVIKNVGTDNLLLNSLSFTGSGASAYKVSSTISSIVPGANATVTITFEPIALITYDADLIIDHNAVNENSQFIFQVKGEGRNADPEISLSQSSPWDFGKVTLPKSKNQNCEISNVGLDPLEISVLSLQTGTEFSIDSIKDSNDQPITLPYYIPVGDKITLSIKFVPTAINTFNDVLTIEHDGTNEISPWNIPIKGKGKASGFDFNGDGISDIIVGADYDDDGGLDAGCVFIFLGNANPSSTIDASLADVRLVGSDPRDGFGHFISDAGDFNNDGYDDIIIGAHIDDDGGLDSGCAFIFFGSANPSPTIYASAADVKLVGADFNDRFGIRVSNAGDFNNDGYDDVIVGAHLDDDGGTDSGCAFIFFGSATPPSTIDASLADVKLIGADPGDRFGVTVSSAADFNNDGYDDVIVGADCDDDGGTDSGCAFIFYGGTTPLTSVDASNADVKLVGADPGDKFGYNVCEKAFDFNKDGIDDVIVGAHADDDGGVDSGCAFIFFGSANPPSTIDASQADVVFTGEDPGDGFGIRVSCAGDLNSDGYDDVIVGAYCDDDGGSESGCAFIFFGSANPSAVVDASLANVKLIGGSSNNRFGHFVCTASDFNNDGYSDVIVGAYLDDDGGTDSGCAFIFFGSATPATKIDASQADVRLVGADSGDRFGISVGG